MARTAVVNDWITFTRFQIRNTVRVYLEEKSKIAHLKYRCITQSNTIDISARKLIAGHVVKTLNLG